MQTTHHTDTLHLLVLSRIVEASRFILNEGGAEAVDRIVTKTSLLELCERNLKLQQQAKDGEVSGILDPAALAADGKDADEGLAGRSLGGDGSFTISPDENDGNERLHHSSPHQQNQQDHRRHTYRPEDTDNSDNHSNNGDGMHSRNIETSAGSAVQMSKSDRKNAETLVTIERLWEHIQANYSGPLFVTYRQLLDFEAPIFPETTQRDRDKLKELSVSKSIISVKDVCSALGCDESEQIIDFVFASGARRLPSEVFQDIVASLGLQYVTPCFSLEFTKLMVRSGRRMISLLPFLILLVSSLLLLPLVANMENHSAMQTVLHFLEADWQTGCPKNVNTEVFGCSFVQRNLHTVTVPEYDAYRFVRTELIHKIWNHAEYRASETPLGYANFPKVGAIGSAFPIGALVIRLAIPEDRTFPSTSAYASLAASHFALSQWNETRRTCADLNISTSTLESRLGTTFGCDSALSIVIPFNSTQQEALDLASRFTLEPALAHTTAIAVEFPAFQPSTGLVIYTKITLSVPEGGGVMRRVTIRPVNFHTADTVLTLLILMCLYCGFTVLKMVFYGKLGHAVWTIDAVVEFVQLAILCASYIMFATLKPLDSNLQVDYIAMEADALINSHSVGMKVLALWVFVTFSSGVRFLREIEGLYLVVAIMQRAFLELIALLIIFGIWTIAFAYTASLLFGSVAPRLATAFSASQFLFQTFTVEDDYDYLESRHQIQGPLFWYAFQVYVSFFVLNLIIAVITAPLQEMKNRATLHIRVVAEIEADMARDAKITWWEHQKWKIRAKVLIPVLNFLYDAAPVYSMKHYWVSLYRFMATLRGPRCTNLHSLVKDSYALIFLLSDEGCIARTRRTPAKNGGAEEHDEEENAREAQEEEHTTTGARTGSGGGRSSNVRPMDTLIARKVMAAKVMEPIALAFVLRSIECSSLSSDVVRDARLIKALVAFDNFTADMNKLLDHQRQLRGRAAEVSSTVVINHLKAEVPSIQQGPEMVGNFFSSSSSQVGQSQGTPISRQSTFVLSSAADSSIWTVGGGGRDSVDAAAFGNVPYRSLPIQRKVSFKRMFNTTMAFKHAGAPATAAAAAKLVTKAAGINDNVALNTSNTLLRSVSTSSSTSSLPMEPGSPVGRKATAAGQHDTGSGFKEPHPDEVDEVSTNLKDWGQPTGSFQMEETIVNKVVDFEADDVDDLTPDEEDFIMQKKFRFSQKIGHRLFEGRFNIVYFLSILGLFVYVFSAELSGRSLSSAYLMESVESGLRHYPILQECFDDNCTSAFSFKKTLMETGDLADLYVWLEKVFDRQMFMRQNRGDVFGFSSVPRPLWDNETTFAAPIHFRQIRASPIPCDFGARTGDAIHSESERDRYKFMRDRFKCFSRVEPFDRSGMSAKKANSNASSSYLLYGGSSVFDFKKRDNGGCKERRLSEFRGYYTVYPCEGYVATVHNSSSLRALMDDGWIDNATRLLAITTSFSRHNAQLEFNIYVELGIGGGSSYVSTIGTALSEDATEFQTRFIVSMVFLSVEIVIIAVKFAQFLYHKYVVRKLHASELNMLLPEEVPTMTLWLYLCVFVVAYIIYPRPKLNERIKFQLIVCVFFLTFRATNNVFFPIAGLFSMDAIRLFDNLIQTFKQILVVVPFFAVFLMAFAYTGLVLFSTPNPFFARVEFAFETVSRGAMWAWDDDELSAAEPEIAAVFTILFFAIVMVLLSNLVLAMVTSAVDSTMVADSQSLAETICALRGYHVYHGDAFEFVFSWNIAILASRQHDSNEVARALPAICLETGRLLLPVEALVTAMGPHRANDLLAICHLDSVSETIYRSSIPYILNLFSHFEKNHPDDEAIDRMKERVHLRRLMQEQQEEKEEEAEGKQQGENDDDNRHSTDERTTPPLRQQQEQPPQWQRIRQNMGPLPRPPSKAADEDEDEDEDDDDDDDDDDPNAIQSQALHEPQRSVSFVFEKK